MPVLDRTWTEAEIRISDAVQGAVEQAARSVSEVIQAAVGFLNGPESWSIASEEGPIVQCAFMTRTGVATRIRLGVATFGSMATVFHYENEASGADLVLPLAPLEREFTADDEEYEYTPREFRRGRTLKVRFQRRGKRAPLRYEGDD
jgi:hypothetical protein